MKDEIWIPPLGQGPTRIVLDDLMMEVIIRVEIPLPNRSLVGMGPENSQENVKLQKNHEGKKG